MAGVERIDLGLVDVQQVIVHFVPPDGDQYPPMRLSAGVSPIPDPSLRKLIRTRVVESLTSKQIYISFAEEGESVAQEQVTSILDGTTDDLVQGSQVLASHLHAVQSGSTSTGILLVTRVDAPGRPGVAIMKMEPQDGASLEWENEICTIQQLDELMLTKQTRMYKVAYFTRSCGDDGTILGLISDFQVSSARRASQYFLRNFLGCRFAAVPEEITKRLLDTSLTFVAEAVDDPDDQMRYNSALLTEFRSNDATISPVQFGVRHLSDAHRQAFDAYLERNDIDPLQTYVKETKLVDTRLKTLTAEFAGGTRVSAPPDAFGNEVTMQELPNGDTELKVVDRFKRFRP